MKVAWWSTRRGEITVEESEHFQEENPGCVSQWLSRYFLDFPEIFLLKTTLSFQNFPSCFLSMLRRAIYESKTVHGNLPPRCFRVLILLLLFRSPTRKQEVFRARLPWTFQYIFPHILKRLTRVASWMKKLIHFEFDWNFSGISWVWNETMDVCRDLIRRKILCSNSSRAFNWF